jgi:hypothetical protein
MTPPTTPTRAERNYVADLGHSFYLECSPAEYRSGNMDKHVLAIMRHLRANPLPEEVK